jgi:adenosylhomocysteine nucleosidase
VQRPRILILTALRIEAAAIARQFAVRLAKNHPTHFTHHNLSIELQIIGVGAIRPPTRPATPPAAIIMAGLAGGLDPTLSIADIIIDESSTWPATPLPFPRQKILCTTQVIGSAQNKARLFATTRAAAVEMENTTIQNLAREWNTPLLHIRSISDTASQTINPAILEFINPFGQVKPAALIAALARHPTLIKELRRLSHNSNLALAALSSAFKLILL